MTKQMNSVLYARYGKFRVDLNDKARVLSGDDMFFEITGFTQAEIEMRQISLYDIIEGDASAEIHTKFVPQLIKNGRCFIRSAVKTKRNALKPITAYGTVNNILGLVDMTLFEDLSSEDNGDIHYTSGLLASTHAGLEIADILEGHKTESFSFLLMRINNYTEMVRDLGLMFTDSAIDNFTRALFRKIKHAYPDAIMGKLNRDAVFLFIRDDNYKIAKDCVKISDEVFQRCYMGKKNKSLSDFSIGFSSFPKDCDDFYSLVAAADKAAAAASENSESYHTYNKTDITAEHDPVVPFDYMPLNSRNFDFAFMSHATSLLSHSMDLNSSLNLLLETAGLRYDLHAVFISEFNANDSTMQQTNFWSAKDGVFDHVTRVDDANEWENFMSGFDSRGFMFIEDTSSDYFSEKDRGFFKKESIYAAINCLLMREKKIIGYVSFCDLEKPRKWSKYEKDTLFELSKLISLYVTVRIERREKADQIYNLSHDKMTGLLNPQTFSDEVISTLYENNDTEISFAMLNADIDNLTYLNDTYGYQEGNKLICAFASKIREEFFLPCRYYGDKFLALCKFRHRDDLLAKVSVMNTEFTRYMRRKYPSNDLSLSIGIYFFGHGDYNLSAAIDNANLMRKEAKNKRDIAYAVYSDDLKAKRNAELIIIGSVHDAIANGNIEVFLQAKCSLSSRQAIGAEALVRWRNDDGSLKYPDQFIPALEKSGYIVAVDFCIYEQVLALLAKWKRDGKRLLPISVNFSRMHMRHKNFVDRICSLASKYGIDRKYVEIEVTESSLSDDKGVMLDCITRLRESGFKIDMDDFGTGYSSLNMLLEAPVDIVKIDKSFIDKSDSIAGQSYIKQIGKLVTASNKDIIFEGVETEEQADFLLDNGYSKIQGYLFDRPIPAKDFEKKYIYVN